MTSNNEWIDTSDRLPPQKDRTGGKVSELVKVLLNTGEEAEDWLINGNWALYCAKSGGKYPVAWKEATT